MALINGLHALDMPICHPEALRMMALSQKQQLSYQCLAFTTREQARTTGQSKGAHGLILGSRFLVGYS